MLTVIVSQLILHTAFKSLSFQSMTIYLKHLDLSHAYIQIKLCTLKPSWC